MIKVEHVEVFNFNGAIRGLRNPMNSWDKSDSLFDGKNINNEVVIERGTKLTGLGKSDLDLMKRLYKAGTEHRKYLRQIFVSMDITAPLYWWKQMDQYRIGVTTNSTSTMHLIANTPITLDCFSVDYDNLDLEVNYNDPVEDDDGWIDHWHIDMFTDYLIQHLEELRQMYLKTKDQRYWKELIRWLPESWMQMRTITMSYENVVNIIHQRSNHKLDEWKEFVKVLKDLPYIKEITGE